MDARQLELAAEYSKLCDQPDLLRVLGIASGCGRDEALTALKAHRRRMQAMQANPKFKDRARFFIKHYRALEAVLEDPAAYLAAVADDQESENLPILEMAIDGMLVDGHISEREEAYVREMAANLGISAETARRVLDERLTARKASRTPVPTDRARSGTTNTMTLSLQEPGRDGTPPPGRRGGAPGTGWWDAGFTALLLDHIPEGRGFMVDVYCRMAWSALTLLPRRPEWTYRGIDRNAERLELASRSIAALATRAELVQGEPAPLPVADDTVDVVLAIRALQTRDDTRPILREAHRVLRPGGRLLVVEPDGMAEAFYFDGHLAAYNQAFHALCARIDAHLQAAYAQIPPVARPGLSIGPTLARRVEEAGFRVKKVAVHAAANLDDVGLEGLVRRLRGYPRALARANGLPADLPEVQACRAAAAELLADRGADRVARGGNVLPLFLCVAVKT